MKISKNIQLILLVLGTILLMFASVYAFTRPTFLDSFFISDKKGEIGDAINGMTAPVTSLLGSVLIYLSLSAQVRANSLIQSQWSYDTFVRVFNDIQIEYSNLSHMTVERAGSGVGPTHVTYTGSGAISKFIEEITEYYRNPQIGILNDISFILEDLRALIEDVDRSDIDIVRKRFILHRINRFYTAKIQIPMNQIKTGLEAAPSEFYRYHISTIVAIDHTIENLRRKYIAGGTVS